MTNIAVLGDKMSVFAFGAFGVRTEVCESESEAPEKLEKLVNDGFKIIYVTEQTAKSCAEQIEKYRFMPEPAIILIPGVSGNTGKGMADVDISVEKAIGSKIV